MHSRNPRQLSTKDFTYVLPDDRIARYPLEERSSSKLLFYDHSLISDHLFSDLPHLLNAGDQLIFNETKVIHARLLFRKATGSVIEVMCLEPADVNDPVIALGKRGHCEWNVLIGNLKRWKEPFQEAEVMTPHGNFTLRAIKNSELNGPLTIRFEWDERFTFAEVIDYAGKLPLPPYFNREAEPSDELRYQTVYANVQGSVAAPTAGLHFTDDVFSALSAKHIESSFVTLHVGAGTFRPIKSENIGEHTMHEERIFVRKTTIETLVDRIQKRDLKSEKNRIIAVGTTSMRTLESLYWIGVLILQGVKIPLHVEQWLPYESTSAPTCLAALQAVVDYLEQSESNILTATTGILIAPGYEFKVVDGLITNFHQPDSTLLLLVAAFVGEDWRTIYEHAMHTGYRFLSYGDSSLLFRS